MLLFAGCVVGAVCCLLFVVDWLLVGGGVGLVLFAVCCLLFVGICCVMFNICGWCRCLRFVVKSLVVR